MNRDRRYSSGLVRYIVDMAAFDSARSLDLLKAIDSTVQANDTLRETFQQVSHQVAKLTEAICERQCESEEDVIDPDGEIREALETAMENLSLIAIDLKRRRAYAVADTSLRDDDGVVESFDLVLESIVEAHDTLNEVNWAVMEHDADASPRSGKGPFKSAKDLIASLG